MPAGQSCTVLLNVLAASTLLPYSRTFRLNQDPNSEHLGTTVWDVSPRHGVTG